MKLLGCSLLLLSGATSLFSDSFAPGVTVYTNRAAWKAAVYADAANQNWSGTPGKLQFNSTGPEIEKILNGHAQVVITEPGYTGGTVVQQSGRSFRDTLHHGDIDQFDLGSAGDFAFGADVTLKRGTSLSFSSEPEALLVPWAASISSDTDRTFFFGAILGEGPYPPGAEISLGPECYSPGAPKYCTSGVSFLFSHMATFSYAFPSQGETQSATPEPITFGFVALGLTGCFLRKRWTLKARRRLSPAQ